MKFVPPRAAVRPATARTFGGAPTSTSIQQKETPQNDKALQTSRKTRQLRNNKPESSTSGSHRYNCRPHKPVCYVDFEEPDFDEFICNYYNLYGCEDCTDYVYEYCSLHLPLIVLPDDEVPSAAELVNFTLTRAELSLPSFFLHVAPSSIEGAGLGVFTTLPMPKGVRFGPYCGDKKPETDFSPYGWLIHGTRKRKTYTMCGDDPYTSNWMRYINCSRNWQEQNLVPFQYQGKIYYRTIKNIPRGRELLVFYGSEYARILNIDLFMYNAPSSRLTGTWGPAKRARSETITSPDLQKHTQSLPIKPQETFPASVKVFEASNSSTNTAEASQTAEPEQANTSHNEIPKQKFECDSCHKIFPWKSNLMVHGLTHIHTPNSKNVQQKEKNRRVNKKIEAVKDNISDNGSRNGVTSLDVRMGRHINVKNNECSVCSRKFSWKSHLSIHMRVHTNEKPYECTICAKRFTQKGGLTTHMRVHTKEKPYECSVCGKKFSQGTSLTRHMRVHTKEKPYECSVCGKKFSHGISLTTHMRVHTKEKPYECSVCGKKFSHGISLTTHMRVHTKEKPYECSVCGKKFSHGISLTTHMRVHTNEKPYECSVCGKRSSRKFDLTTHMRVHTKEKPYECSVCGKRSSRKFDLTTHMRVHTGEKPYQCVVCSRTFSQRFGLNTHMKTHRG